MRNYINEKIHYNYQLIDYYQSKLQAIQQGFSNKLAQIELVKNQLKQKMSLLMINKSTLLTNSFNQIDSYLAKTKVILENKQKQLNDLSISNNNLLKSKLEKEQNNLYNSIVLLDSLNPTNVLKRGFSITKKNDQIISSQNHLAIEDNITLQYHDGIVYAKVTGKD